MRIDRQRGEQQQRQAAALDLAKLAMVKGGLKADRVQDTDPTAPGGG